MRIATTPRFTSTQRYLHWGMAVLILAAYVLIEQRGLFERGTSERAAMVQGHFWVGIAVFCLAWWRLAHRRRDGVPPILPAPGRATALASRLTHWALYGFFIVMPLLGLATAWTDGKQVLIPFTGIALPQLLQANEDLAHTLEDLHGTIGEVFYWVIGLHVLAALWHQLMRGDNTLRRML